jgi:hypothetical protein
MLLVIIVRNCMNYVAEVDSKNITFILSFVQIGQLHQKLKWREGHIQHTQHGDLIRLCFSSDFFPEEGAG